MSTELFAPTSSSVPAAPRRHAGAYLVTSVAHRARSVNFTMSDGSVRAQGPSRPVSLQALALSLRRAGDGAVAMAWGAPLPAWSAVLSLLRQRGAPIGQPMPWLALGTRPALPALLVLPDAAGAAGASAGIVFLGVPPATPAALLLPAVQCAREAARRASGGDSVDLVLVQPGRGSSRSVPTDSYAFNFTHLKP